MAQRRMFSPQIVDSDAFLDMSSSAQNLYFHLGMRADDDGFVGNPKKVLRMVGGNDDDLKILLAKRFLLSFETGVIVIKHWRINNLIRKDWYKETVYLEEKNALKIRENGAYTERDKKLVNENATIRSRRLGKVRLGKVNTITDNKKVVRNDIELLSDYVVELKGNEERPERYYRAAGELLTLCDHSLEAAKKHIEKTREWADEQGLEWEMDTAVKKYLEVK